MFEHSRLLTAETDRALRQFALEALALTSTDEAGVMSPRVGAKEGESGADAVGEGLFWDDPYSFLKPAGYTRKRPPAPASKSDVLETGHKAATGMHWLLDTRHLSRASRLCENQYTLALNARRCERENQCTDAAVCTEATAGSDARPEAAAGTLQRSSSMPATPRAEQSASRSQTPLPQARPGSGILKGSRSRSASATAKSRRSCAFSTSAYSFAYYFK